MTKPQVDQQLANSSGPDGVNALDFPGNDLGAKINSAFSAGNLAVYVPNQQGLVIRTTIKLPHAGTVKASKRYPEHIVCKTRGKPVYEVMGGIRHWSIEGGIYDGDGSETPSCFLLCGRADNVEGGGQCGDTTALDGVQTTGNWGHSVVTNIAGEILIFDRCHLWMTGKGDFNWNKSRATIMIGNLDFWGVPSSYYPPNKKSGSCSAIIFENCDLRCDGGNTSVFLLKGQVEDVTITPSYLNSHGKAHIVIEPGDIGGGNWTSPRGIKVLPGGRSECNGGPVNPLVLVDGLGVAGAGVYHLEVGSLGIFTSNPVFKAINRGQIYHLTFNEGSHLEAVSTLIEHKDADLNWANIVCRFNARIDCGSKAIADSDIKIAGEVISGATYRSLIRAKNVQDFDPRAIEAPSGEVGDAADQTATAATVAETREYTLNPRGREEREDQEGA